MLKCKFLLSFCFFIMLAPLSCLKKDSNSEVAFKLREDNITFNPESNLFYAAIKFNKISFCISFHDTPVDKEFAQKTLVNAKEAFQNWFSIVNLTPEITGRIDGPFCEQQSIKNGSLQIALHFNRSIFEKTFFGGELGVGIFTSSKAIIDLNVQGIKDPLRDATGKKTLTHEIGHSLGLFHSDKIHKSIMYEKIFEAANEISADDKAGIREIFSKIKKSLGSQPTSENNNSSFQQAPTNNNNSGLTQICYFGKTDWSQTWTVQYAFHIDPKLSPSLNVFSINKSTGETQKWGEYKLIVNQNGWQSEDGVKFKISGNIQSQTLNLLHTSDSNGGKPVQTQLNLVNCDQGN